MLRTKKFLIVIILFVLSYLLIDKMPYANPVQTQESLAYFPLTIGEWKGQDVYEEEKELPSRTDEYLYRKYVNVSGESLFLYIGFWGKYRHGADVFSGRHLLPAYKWDIMSSKVNVIVSQGKKISVKEIVYTRNHSKISQFYWYMTNNGITTRRFKERLRHGIHAILNRHTNVALIRLTSSQYSIDTDDRYSTFLTEFTRKITPVLEEFLPFNM